VSLGLDGSTALAWIYAEETTETVRQVFAMVAEDGAVVPALWRLEIANSLTVAVRRSRITAEFRNAALADLALLDITTIRIPMLTAGRRHCILPTASG
jgi:hypothetical protein